jgi:undecaprenyl-diphosphatase
MKFFFIGILQGITEFLPVSSSGHLFILKRLLHLNENLLAFFVFLHIPTLLAVVIFLWRKIIALLFEKKLILHIGIITLITGVCGLAIKHYFSNFFEAKYLVSFCLCINGVILLISGKTHNKRSLEDIRFRDSLVLGILQGIAVFPGISRSGITIVGLLKRGFEPQEAFAFSFLMSIPAIVGAFFLEFKDLTATRIMPFHGAVSFAAAFCFGILSLMIVKKTIIIAKFNNFGYYCLIVSLINLIV